MFARFDEISAMTLQDIKETKCYARMHGHTDSQTDNVKTVHPPQTKFASGIIQDQKITLVNLYRPSEDKPPFFEDIRIQK